MSDFAISFFVVPLVATLTVGGGVTQYQIVFLPSLLPLRCTREVDVAVVRMCHRR